MYENIKERYLKGYIRDDQLDRYVKLDVITEEQAEQLKMEKIGGGGVTKPLIIIRKNGVEVQVYA
nr:MAG TPA: hypothetical protein [Caudoviricetes sp.]